MGAEEAAHRRRRRSTDYNAEKNALSIDGLPAVDPSRRSAGDDQARRRKVVWSSGDGDLRKARDPRVAERLAAGGRVKVRRETAGRRGKAVTTVSGVPLDDAACASSRAG